MATIRKRLTDKQFDALMTTSREAQETAAIAQMKQQTAQMTLELILDAHGFTMSDALRLDDKTKELVIEVPDPAPEAAEAPKHVSVKEYLDSQ